MKKIILSLLLVTQMFTIQAAQKSSFKSKLPYIAALANFLCQQYCIDQSNNKDMSEDEKEKYSNIAYKFCSPLNIWLTAYILKDLDTTKNKYLPTLFSISSTVGLYLPFFKKNQVISNDTKNKIVALTYIISKSSSLFIYYNAGLSLKNK